MGGVLCLPYVSVSSLTTPTCVQLHHSYLCPVQPLLPTTPCPYGTGNPRAGVGSDTAGATTAAAGANSTSSSSPSTSLSALPTNGVVLLPAASAVVRIGNSTTALTEPLARGPYLQGWTELRQDTTMSVSGLVLLRGAPLLLALPTHVACRGFGGSGFRDRNKVWAGWCRCL